jgi:hypothetical protein
MHQLAGTGIWHRDMTKKMWKKQNKKGARDKSNINWQAAGAMTWRLLTRHLAQMRWRSSRSPWKLSDFSGRLIVSETIFASTLMIALHMCKNKMVY